MDSTRSRFLKNHGGSVALSPCQNCTPINTAISPANPQNSPMTVALFHAYSVPPHCSARSRQMMAGRKTAVPGRSSSRTRERKGRARAGVSWALRRRTKAMVAMPRAPTGRLM